MRNKIWIFAVISVLFLTCNSDDEGPGLCIEGSGTVNDYPLELTSFDKVALFGPANLRITQDAEQSVIVEAEPEIFEYVTYEVNNGQLEIGIKEDISCFNTLFGLWINITVPDIERIDIVGASEIISPRNLELDKLEIVVLGAGNISLTGSVNEQIIDVSGVIDLSNFEFVSQETRISVTGSGSLEVTCESLLDIRVSGAATIKYKGDPQINQTVTGTINLINSN